MSLRADFRVAVVVCWLLAAATATATAAQPHNRSNEECMKPFSIPPDGYGQSGHVPAPVMAVCGDVDWYSVYVMCAPPAGPALDPCDELRRRGAPASGCAWHREGGFCESRFHCRYHTLREWFDWRVVEPMNTVSNAAYALVAWMGATRLPADIVRDLQIATLAGLTFGSSAYHATMYSIWGICDGFFMILFMHVTVAGFLHACPDACSVWTHSNDLDSNRPRQSRQRRQSRSASFAAVTLLVLVGLQYLFAQLMDSPLRVHYLFTATIAAVVVLGLFFIFSIRRRQSAAGGDSEFGSGYRYHQQPAHEPESEPDAEAQLQPNKSNRSWPEVESVSDVTAVFALAFASMCVSFLIRSYDDNGSTCTAGIVSQASHAVWHAGSAYSCYMLMAFTALVRAPLTAREGDTAATTDFDLKCRVSSQARCGLRNTCFVAITRTAASNDQRFDWFAHALSAVCAIAYFTAGCLLFVYGGSAGQLAPGVWFGACGVVVLLTALWLVQSYHNYRTAADA